MTITVSQGPGVLQEPVMAEAFGMAGESSAAIAGGFGANVSGNIDTNFGTSVDAGYGDGYRIILAMCRVRFLVNMGLQFPWSTYPTTIYNFGRLFLLGTDGGAPMAPLAVTAAQGYAIRATATEVSWNQSTGWLAGAFDIGAATDYVFTGYRLSYDLQMIAGAEAAFASGSVRAGNFLLGRHTEDWTQA